MGEDDLRQFLNIKNPSDLSRDDWRRYVFISLQDIQRFFANDLPHIKHEIAINSWTIRVVGGAIIIAAVLNVLHL